MKTLKNEEADSLEKMFTKEEVKNVVYSMEEDKSLGPDGFSIAFYRECSDIIKEHLMKAFAEFFERGTINKGVNATCIILIPKKNDAKDFSDFHLISLVCSLYKIIDKVLSLRIRVVMEKITLNTQ